MAPIWGAHRRPPHLQRKKRKTERESVCVGVVVIVCVVCGMDPHHHPFPGFGRLNER